MRVTIIKNDRVVGVDGEFYRVKETSDLPHNFWALQWEGRSGVIEWTDSPETTIRSLKKYQYLLDAWAQVKAKLNP